MKTRQLEVFHAIYTRGTITEAATFLNVSQPSISKVLAHTESQLGFLLFSRIKGRLFPTPEADAIFLKADKINTDLNQLKELTENMSSKPSGLIRLGCAPTLGLDLIPTLVSDFSSINPGARFETHAYHFDEMIDHLRDGSIDFGIAFEAKEYEDVECIRILEGNFVVLGSSDYLFSKKILNLKDLKDIPFVGIEGPLSEKLYSYFSQKKFIPNFITKTDSYLMAASYVKKGLGISVLDQISASSLNSSEFIWRLKDAPSCDVYLVVPKKISKSHIQENFISFTLSHNYKL
jgi:DNA-binding transcriptional LysR family regulator